MNFLKKLNCWSHTDKEQKEVEEKSKDKTTENQVEDNSFEYIVQNSFSLIPRTFGIKNEDDYKDYLRYTGNKESILIGRLTTIEISNILKRKHGCECHFPLNNKVFEDELLNARTFKKVHVINKNIDKGGNVFNKEELLSAYESLTESFNNLRKTGFNLVIKNIGDIPASSFSPKVKEIYDDGCIHVSIPVWLTTLSLEEINALNWRESIYEDDNKKPVQFNSVAEFNMYCNNIFGDEDGVSRLMETKKLIDSIINTSVNIKNDAKKLFGMEQ